MDLGRMADMARKAQALEQQLTDQFLRTRDTVAASQHVSAPRPAEHAPQAPGGHGFYSPAPPNAPRLPPPTVSPDEARRRLDEGLARIRQLADHLHNSARLARGIAELLERAIPR